MYVKVLIKVLSCEGGDEWDCGHRDVWIAEI